MFTSQRMLEEFYFFMRTGAVKPWRINKVMWSQVRNVLEHFEVIVCAIYFTSSRVVKLACGDYKFLAGYHTRFKCSEMSKTSDSDGVYLLELPSNRQCIHNGCAFK